jgi:peptidoglycan/xylan/chitin deacetylase (PgdA/CDA1 family)
MRRGVRTGTRPVRRRLAAGVRQPVGVASVIAALLVGGCSAASPTLDTRGSSRPSGSPSPPAASSLVSTGELAPTATGTPLLTGPSPLVEHGDRASDQVALTFTVGYQLDPALEILQLLRSRGVPATIFMSGIVFDQDQTRADAEAVLAIITQRSDLFQLGQHGYSAGELAKLPTEEVITEVRGAELAMARYGVTQLGPYFSPPGGAWSPALLATLGSLGYSTSVLWDVDPLDWKPPADGGPSAAEVAARVLDRVQGGSIILLHLGGWNTLPALPAILDGLTARGLRPVTVAELLAE